MCTNHLAYPPIDGASLRIFNIFKFLSQNHEVFLFLIAQPETNIESVEEFLNQGIIKGYRYVINPPGFSLLKSPFSRATNRQVRTLKKSVEKLVQRIIQEQDIDLIHIHTHQMGLLLADVHMVPRVLDLTDSSTLYALRMERSLQKPGHLLLNTYYLFRAAWNEKLLLNRYNTVTVVSPVDRYYLRMLNRTNDIHVIQNGVEVEKFTPRVVQQDMPSIVFFGNMSFLPNIDAALFLVNDILPLVRHEIPETKCYLIGANPSKHVKELGNIEGVIVTGFVDDIAEWISKGTVIVIPMRRGGGQKNKILEAMILQKPVVTTPIGAEAMVGSVQAKVRIGQTAQEIADETVKLLQKKPVRDALAREGSSLVRTQYSWNMTAKLYEKLYASLLTHE